MSWSYKVRARGQNCRMATKYSFYLICKSTFWLIMLIKRCKWHRRFQLKWFIYMTDWVRATGGASASSSSSSSSSSQISSCWAANVEEELLAAADSFNPSDLCLSPSSSWYWWSDVPDSSTQINTLLVHYWPHVELILDYSPNKSASKFILILSCLL